MILTEEAAKRSDSGFFLRNAMADMLQEEIYHALTLYLKIAKKIFEGDHTKVLDVSDSFFSLTHNFFSMLFLLSYHYAQINRKHRIFYAAVNQCLRGMVTGCDNLLDDEYKETLPTNLPETGTRFRSVLDIMVSDRVLFELLLYRVEANELTVNQARRVSAMSLKALLKSGIEEAGEEDGIKCILPPQDILTLIHHYKTGLLFQAPWCIPALLETVPKVIVDQIKQALYHIGMGCQIMDDVVDFGRDFQKRRHNYLLSVLYHLPDSASRRMIDDIRASGDFKANQWQVIPNFSKVRSESLHKALIFLKMGLGSLFLKEHGDFVEPAIWFLIKRIGIAPVWFDQR